MQLKYIDLKKTNKLLNIM